MLTLLALLAAPSALAADDCLITVDKDIKDPAPAVFVNCSVKGERLDTGKGLRLTKPDGSGGTTETVNPLGDHRMIFRDALVVKATDVPPDVIVGVGEAVDAKGNPRGRRGTCRFADIAVAKRPTRNRCSLKLDGNTETTEIEVVVRLDAKGRAVFRAVVVGETFTADETPYVDVRVVDDEDTTLGSGALTFRGSRASTTLAFTDSELKVFGTAASDSAVWKGWSYAALASDGKTEVISGKTDIEPDILDGSVNIDVNLDGEGALELDLRGRADRDQDLADLKLTVCESDCLESTVLDAEISLVQRYGLDASGKGDPLGNSWTITSTGFNEDGKVVAGPFKVTVEGVEGREAGTRNITGGSLRKDGIRWRLRGKKRVDWLEWDNTELIARTRLPAHKWTHVVVASGKSSLTVGGEQWRDQSARADLSVAPNEDTKALLDIFSAEDFGGVVNLTLELIDSAGKTVSKGGPTKTVVTADKDSADWNLSMPYTWP